MRLVGGPLNGQVADLPTLGELPLPRQLLLSELDDGWHCYQVVPYPDSDVRFHLSYLGAVAALPRLVPADADPVQPTVGA